MTLKSFTIIAVIAASMGIVSSAALAQGDIKAIPANFPPESFTGKQFVDNNGCVFVRAGFDGNTTWVPRVTRQRKQICGQTPTFGGTMARAPEPKSATPIVIAAPDPAPMPAPAPQPAPKPGISVAKPTGNIRVMQGTAGVLVTPAPQTAARQPVPEVRRVPASKPVMAQPPRMVRRVPAPPAAPKATARAMPVPNYSGACIDGARTQISNGQTVVVRCGAQAAPKVSVVRRGEGQNVDHSKGWQGSALSGSTRIVPRHVYEQQQHSQVASVPKGYRPAWDDDRLNPLRAHQTVAGYMATQKVWTNTVPRQLAYNVRNHKIKAPVIAYHAKAKYSAPVVSSKGNTPIVSTRSTPKAAAARYVEIGVFTSEAKAKAAASRLTAAGLPVRFGSYKKGGQSLRRVMVGPYATTAALGKALAATKSVGYVQAYLN
ncbi:SPOR domain-containing protein [Primorskyibacter sp. 2E233]|uniref:SPOR domain-containing protein n=1 Tax=Primorskyibacter sp. 2E233 TaxID=3413431 RepID=UPI003BF36370